MTQGSATGTLQTEDGGTITFNGTDNDTQRSVSLMGTYTPEQTAFKKNGSSLVYDDIEKVIGPHNFTIDFGETEITLNFADNDMVLTAGTNQASPASGSGTATGTIGSG